MRLKQHKAFTVLILAVFCVIQCEIAASYRTEVEITPAPPEEETTKKSGFFSGIKNFFRSSPSTEPTVLDVTTPKSVPPPAQLPKVQSTPNTFANAPNAGGPAAANNRPPPLTIGNAPLMPLGPRPDTPPSSPLAGNQQQPPQWPQSPSPASSPASPTVHTPQNIPHQLPQRPQPAGAGATTNFGMSQPQYPQPTNFGTGQRPAGAQPNFPAGLSPYHPPKPQPSGLDLSYGGGFGGRPQSGAHPGFGLAPLTSSTTSTTTSTSTTTTTPRSAALPAINLDLRGGFDSTTSTTPRSPQHKEDFPPLPPPRRPSVGAKEDFPALPTPSSPFRPSSPGGISHPATPTSPSVWGSSKPTFPAHPASASHIPSTPAGPSSTPAAQPGGNRVAFVPHAPSDRTTTLRPGTHSTGNSLATDDEIRALTETLYNKEVSQLNLLRVSPQGKTRSIDSTDEAPQPLLDVDARVFEVPTIAKMRLLFNNYEDDTMTNEHVTPNERKEENDFVDAVMATNVMRQAMLFLQNKGIVSPDPKTHRDLVKELWFTQYSRGSGKIGSSGFEHVFVHEVKNGTLIGLHNWVYFADEEKNGNLDYKGYLKQIDLGDKAKVLKTRFTHKGVNKPVNGLFVGTTPELELALYTVCFQLRPDRSCPVSMGNTKFEIVTYSWRYRGKSLIGSAFPEL